MSHEGICPDDPWHALTSAASCSHWAHRSRSPNARSEIEVCHSGHAPRTHSEDRANHNHDTPRQTPFAAAAKYMLRGGVHRWRTRSTRTTAHPRSKSISPERRPSTHRVDGCRATALRYLQKAGGPPGRRPALSGLGRPSWCVRIWGVHPFYGTLAA